jgi:hypothetical protein
MSTPALAAALLAKAPSGEAAKSGPWGLAIILILCAVCYFLFKSMSKHMRKVREEFPVQGKKPESPAQQADSAPEAADQVRPDNGADAGPDAGDGPAQP